MQCGLRVQDLRDRYCTQQIASVVVYLISCKQSSLRTALSTQHSAGLCLQFGFNSGIQLQSHMVRRITDLGTQTRAIVGILNVLIDYWLAPFCGFCRRPMTNNIGIIERSTHITKVKKKLSHPYHLIVIAKGHLLSY